MARKRRELSDLPKDIQDWYEWMNGPKKKMSKTTMDGYLRRLHEVEFYIGHSRLDLIEMPAKQVQNLLTGLIEKLENNRYDHKKNVWLQNKDDNGNPIGYAGSYIASLLKGVYCYLDYNEAECNGFKISKKDVGTPRLVEFSPTLENLPVPDQNDVHNILMHATDIRDRAMISLISFLGVRTEVVGNIDGTDGLTFEDLLDFNMDTLTFTERAPRIRVRTSISKNSKAYFGLLCDEGVSYLENYFRIRRENKEDIKESSPIITHNRITLDTNGDEITKPFITTKTVGASIRKAIRKAGLKNRPYDLRNYYAHRIEIFMHPDRSQYLMGHKGRMMARYTNPMRFPVDKLEELRGEFLAGQKFLQTDITKVQVDEMMKSIGTIEAKNDALKELLLEKLSESKKREDEMRLEIENLKKGYGIAMNHRSNMFIESLDSFRHGPVSDEQFNKIKDLFDSEWFNVSE